jgi:hypothetical protein
VGFGERVARNRAIPYSVRLWPEGKVFSILRRFRSLSPVRRLGVFPYFSIRHFGDGVASAWRRLGEKSRPSPPIMVFGLRHFLRIISKAPPLNTAIGGLARFKSIVILKPIAEMQR